MSFFHGVRTKQVASGSTTINALPSCIVAIVGVSPVGPTQELVICNNDTDDAQFGEATPNNNIANTLAIIRSVVKGATGGDGSCAVVVVNVYSTTHRTALDHTATPDATTGKCSLAKTIIGELEDVEILDADDEPVNEAAGGTYVFGTDYTLDRYGNFVDLTGDYLGIALTFGGTGIYYLNTSSVTGAHIIGANTSGVRTGRVLLDECEATYEFKPKILLCPLYATLTGVQADFEAAATSYRGVWLSDAASATSFSAALALRTTGQWATAVPATIPVFPWLKSYNAFANDDIDYPYSAFMAGMLVATDNLAGPWESPSNRQIPGVTGAQLRLTTGYNNSGSEISQLNAKGIVTYQKKSGFRTWGNRNAKFPSSGEVTNFINIYRMDCQVSDEMESALAEYNDKNITKSMIDSIKTTGNNYLKVLMQKGAVLPGSSIYFDPAKNSTTELANGHLVLTRKYMISTPAEQIEIENVLDIELFAALLK